MPVLKLDQVILQNADFRIPRVVAFNRLESRPRTTDFTRSLRAEVRDPLWLLTRQWQFGEFKGEDAASPVSARISYQHRSMGAVAFGGTSAPYDPQVMPLETFIEREPIPLVLRETSDGQTYSDLVFAVRWGRRFFRDLRAAGLEGNHGLYLEKYPLRALPATPPPGDPLRVPLDAEAEQICGALAGRVADGVAIWRAVRSGAHDAWIDAASGSLDKPALKSFASGFAQACDEILARLYTQPQEASAWRSEHLEYSFTLEGEAGTVLAADQYHQGRLDWHSFDIDSATAPARERVSVEPTEKVESFLPGPVRFKGQPCSRFWQMEEAQTDFGKIETSPTGLLHMMLAEFGLIYSNDWFMLPHPMDINTLCEIRGILVDDTFGRHTYVRPAGRGPETAWQRFAMFHLTRRGGEAGANSFYLAPTADHVLQSPPLERVNFLRDEMANMVWGVEAIVPAQMGRGVSGDMRNPTPAGPPPAAGSDEVKIRYNLGTVAPANWIPFIPVHLEGSTSEIRLQRARMAGGQPPRGRLLREPGSPYFIFEEEIPRAGVYVERAWQRTRWIGGRTLTWIGRTKTAGRGEGWSELLFDSVLELGPPVA